MKPGSVASFSLLRAGNQPAYAAFTEEGPHALEIETLDGRCVLKAAGKGPKAYSLDCLERKTVYSVSGETSSGPFSRRLLIP
jgi:hypothetical protein